MLSSYYYPLLGAVIRTHIVQDPSLLQKNPGQSIWEGEYMWGYRCQLAPWLLQKSPCMKWDGCDTPTVEKEEESGRKKKLGERRKSQWNSGYAVTKEITPQIFTKATNYTKAWEWVISMCKIPIWVIGYQTENIDAVIEVRGAHAYMGKHT